MLRDRIHFAQIKIFFEPDDSRDGAIGKILT